MHQYSDLEVISSDTLTWEDKINKGWTCITDKTGRFNLVTYKCNNCGQTFDYEEYIKKHIRKKHFIEDDQNLVVQKKKKIKIQLYLNTKTIKV